MAECVNIGDATLWLADNREILSQLQGIDHIITDPPYSEKTHNGARTHGLLDASFIDFDSISEADFLRFSEQAVGLARRWVVMTCAWQHAAKLEESGLPLVRAGIWRKTNGAPQFTGDRPGMGWEMVAILHRKGKKRWNGGGAHGCWECPIEQGGYPTQKPLPLISQWVRQFTDEGETVLDPYMGSGTTGSACLRLGRRFVGIEVRKEAFDLACKRIQEAYDQPNLFKNAPKAEQKRLFT
jgi:site-specific DNA-methyltransferase (adenine-specific)